MARPPERSNVAPVLKEQPSEHSHKTNSATSSTVPSRLSGLLATMAATASGDSCFKMSVSMAAGATLFTRISVSATSLARHFVKAMTPALAAEALDQAASREHTWTAAQKKRVQVRHGLLARAA